MSNGVCAYCHRPLTEIDCYGEMLVGCVDCNRWGRPDDEKLRVWVAFKYGITWKSGTASGRSNVTDVCGLRGPSIRNKSAPSRLGFLDCHRPLNDSPLQASKMRTFGNGVNYLPSKELKR